MTAPRVLIVEDNVAREARPLGRRLERLGFGVVGIARCIEEAIEKARQHEPDVAIIDIMIPAKPRGKRLDDGGITAAKGVQEVSKARVIFFTGANTTDTLLRKARQARPYELLTKPCSDEQIRAAI